MATGYIPTENQPFIKVEIPAGSAVPTMRIDTTVGERVFITDGVTEKRVFGFTGARNITALAPNITSGNVYISREGNTVTMTLDTVIMAGATGGSYDMFPNGSIPVGFRPARTNWFNGIDGPPGVRRVGVAAGGWVPIYLSPVPGDVYRGTISWVTTNAWPTTLPGTPA